MSGRIRTAAAILVVLAVGIFLGSAASQWWVPAPAPSSATAILVPPGERVRVEVLNGGGREGMARAATDRLRDHGFDVVYFGNAPSFDHDRSVVYDRIGRIDLARATADRLGIETVLSEPDSNLYLDVSVVLGEEWGPPPDPETAVEPAWWDVRRFFGPRDTTAAPAPGHLANPESQGR